MALTRWPVVLVLVLAACGEPAMSPAEYFSELQPSSTGFAQATDDVDGRYTAQLSITFDELQDQYDLTIAEEAEEFARRSIEVSVEATAAFVTATVEGMERYLDDLSGLRPPETVEEAHSATLDALRRARDGLDPTLQAVRGVGAVGELESAVRSSPLGEALVRIGEACQVLQAAAADEGLVIDLQCPEQ